MTESLQMAIERLLQALDDRTGDVPSDSDAFAILRARLIADAADALSLDAAEPTLSNAQMSNELAAYLDARLSAEDREHLVELLAHDSDARAAVESAAAFLDSLPPQPQQVSPALMAEAMAAFAPHAAIEPEPMAATTAAAAPAPATAPMAARVEPIRAASPAPVAAPRRVNWGLYGAMAATLVIGVIGGMQLWQSAGPSGQAPTGANLSTHSGPTPLSGSRPASPAGPTTSQPPQTDMRHAEPSAKSNANCDAAKPADQTGAAAPPSDKALAPHADTPAKPCPPLNLHPEAASPAQQNAPLKPGGPAAPGSPY
ncbi:MAG TPA: hypothetical protein VL492_09220 [Methylovirgula sp.]|nr:hypothetical protein [Methylovirgula sp.]